MKDIRKPNKILTKSLLVLIPILVITILLICAKTTNGGNNQLNSSIKKVLTAMNITSNSKTIDSKDLQITVEDDPSWNATSTRPFLYYTRNETFGGVERKNYMHVFAFEGDTICIGTNIYNSNLNLEGNANIGSNHPDDGSIDVVMHDLKDNLIPIDIKGQKGSPGYIMDVATEKLAKTMTSPEGNSDDLGNVYVPYTYIVRETGIYTFEFRSYSGSGNTNIASDNNKSNGWSDPSKVSGQGGIIAAWDITVFNENKQKEKGRTYTDSLSLQMNGKMREKYYIMTKDSYIYEMKFSDIEPWTFSFFSNNKGITNSANGNIIYKSVKDLRNDITFSKFGVNYTAPTTDDTDDSKNFYIFFEQPNEDLVGHMYGEAILPDPATNLKFSADNQIYEGSGGYFSFDVQEATTATLRIDFNIEKKDGTKYAPVEISDVVKPYSTSYFYWDGKDGNGEVIPAGEYSYNQIKYTVTTKAGEIHFPLIDVENVQDGITFTRINNIFKKNGEQVDVSGNIYDKTRSVIYYDDTAIYYGEKITSTGASERDITYETSTKVNGTSVKLDTPIPFGQVKDAKGNSIFSLRNIIHKDNGEYKAYNEYGSKHELRVGDHSYINNKINYKGSYESQKELIDYLDSSKNPVGLSKTASNYISTNDHGALQLESNYKAGNYNSTTDYGIANYWTFITSDAVEPSNKEGFNIKGGSDLFNLTARVFYDEETSNGIYDKQKDKDHLLDNVKLNLYKKTSDTVAQQGKTYVIINGTDKNRTVQRVADLANVGLDKTVYELVSTGVTPLQGEYIFTGLEYDKTNGTEYLYQVIRPNTSFEVTSQNKKATDGIKTEKTTIKKSLVDNTTTVNKEVKEYKYGHYTLYKYDNNSFGTEVQTFTVGGTGINLDDQANKTVTTIDVGYKYVRNSSELNIKKTWKITDSTTTIPSSAVLEVCYNTDSGTTIYEEHALSAILSWNYSYKYLETEIQGQEVKDWYVSAEYYIYKDKIFRHRYQYDVANKIYKSFVGDDSYFSLSEYYEKYGTKQSADKVYTMDDIPDFNNDGLHNWNDLKFIPEVGEKEEDAIKCWRTALAAGSQKQFGQVIAPFSSVLDRNVGTAVTEINITNSSEPGTIEVLKYTGAKQDEHYLSGATFRIYEGEISHVKAIIEEYDAALRDFSNATSANKSELQKKLNEASAKVNEIQVGSASTRVNGRVAFPGLDPDSTYTIRERFAPSGYRILEEYYQVDSKDKTDSKSKFNSENYYLLSIGNAEASGDLGIRKTISGRTWVNDDSFSFDFKFDNGIEPTTSERAIFNSNEKNIDDEINEFLQNFAKEDDVAITYKTPYAKVDDKESPDTKIYSGLLKNGIPDEEGNRETASLLGFEFPVAGNYTFTIKENKGTNSTLEYSTRLFTVTIDVSRVLNSDEEENSTETLDNTHLEANVSKIVYQELKEDGVSYGDSVVFAGNNPTFVNNYIVKDVEQSIRYVVKKQLNGREGNNWLNDDKFTFVLTGYDEATKEALRGEHIKIAGEGIQENEDKTEKRFEISSKSTDHQFSFSEIDFNGITFEVTDDEEGNPISKPITYWLTIQEEIPVGADENVYEGIEYSTDIYTLKVTLENSDHSKPSVSGEADGLIDKITFELYKDYNHNEGAVNTPYSKCIINRTKDASGNVVENGQHATGKDSHVMTFENNCKTTVEVTKIWDDDGDAKEKRPESIEVTLEGTSKNGYSSKETATITNQTGWTHTFENVTKYDEQGEKVNYVVHEKETRDGDLILYESTVGEVKEKEGQDGYEVQITNKFRIPTTKVDIELEKIWDDNGNVAEKRPTSVTLIFEDKELQAEVNRYEEELTALDKDPNYKVSGKEKWIKTIRVPEYDKNGNKIVYDHFTLSEEVDSIFYKGTVEGNTTVTNSFVVPQTKISIDVKKIWNHENNKYEIPTQATIQLKNGESVKETVVINKDNTRQEDENTWIYTFSNLDKYDSMGNEINYTVSEVGVGSGELKYYKETIDNKTIHDTTRTITNTYIGPIISQEKTLSKQYEEKYAIEREKLTYTITVTNEGGLDKNVTIKDNIPEGTTFVTGSIKVNGGTTYNGTDYSKKTDEDLSKGITVNVPAKSEGTNGEVRLSFEVSVNDLKDKVYETQIKNIAEVDGQNTKEVITEVKKPNITFRKESTPETGNKVQEGDIITYRIVLGNVGTISGETIVKDIIPVGTSFVNGSIKINETSNYDGVDLSAKTSQDLERGITIKVDPNQEMVLEFQVKVNNINNMDVISNKAQVNKEPQKDVTKFEDTNEVQHTFIKPIITTTKTMVIDEDYVISGNKIQYSILVENGGGLDKNVLIKDNIPHGTTFVEGSIKVNGKSEYGEVDYSKNTGKDLVDGITVNVPAKTDDTNGQITLSFEVTVNDGANGDIINVATVDGEKTNEVKVPVLKFEKVSEVIRKEISEDDEIPTTTLGEKEVTVGDSIKYTIKVYNTGTVKVQNIDVTDTVPAGLKVLSISEEGTEKKEDINWNIPVIEGKKSASVSFVAEVKYDREEHMIQNVAKVDGNETNSTENLYKRTDIQLQSSVQKTGAEKIVSKDENVYYELEFSAKINYFVGKAVITLVDTLPYSIDEQKSDLAGGKYDIKANTITWTQTEDIDTFSTWEAKTIKSTKAIKLSYIYDNLDEIPETIENVVNSQVELREPISDDSEQYNVVKTDEKEARVETSIEIPTEVIVHHYIYDGEKDGEEKYTDIRLADDEHMEGIIGKQYSTSVSSKVPSNYKYVEVRGETEGKMKEETIEVNYYYELQTPTILSSIDKTANANKVEEGIPVLTKEDGVVSYKIKNNVTIKDYIGKAKIEIVDKLPANIDVSKSNLAEGSYNKETNTITWIEEIDVNTYKSGDYKKTITKEIKLVYEGQDVLSDLVNTVTGKVITYYPENHSSKAEEEFIIKEVEGKETVKQEYKVDLEIVKEWEDNKDSRGKRPESVTMVLTNNTNGKKKEIVLNEENNWRYLAQGLAKYDENGRKVIYEVTEKETKEKDLEYYEDPVITLIEEQTDKVTSYKFKVVNTYRLLNTDLKADMTKEGTKEITSSRDKVDYTINFEAEIKEYIGEGKVTIVDTLPYKIDEKSSDLNGGKYDDGSQTITWEEELEHISTVETRESKKIKITKEISVLYKDIDLTTEKMTNEVKGKIELYETDEKDEADTQYDTNINVNGKVTVRYVDKDSGRDISKKDYNYVITGKVGKDYSTQKKDIQYYDYIESTNNENGKITEKTQEVIYYYTRIKTSVLVKYQDREGNQLLDDILIKGQIWNQYETEKKKIENYRFVESTDNTSGTMTEEQIIVIYTYEKIPSKVIVKYLEKSEEGKEPKELLPTEVFEGFAGDEYKTERKIVENYRAAEPEPENASGKMKEEEQEVIYYYERIPSGIVKVKYVNIETKDEIIYRSKIKEVYGYEIKGYVGDQYTTKQIAIPYYVFVKNTNNTEGILTETGDTVIYYYRKQVFNLSVENNIKEITLNGNNKEILDDKLAKVEIKSTEIEETNLIVKYDITVVNNGEIAGKAKILEIVPEGYEVINKEEYWNSTEEGIFVTDVNLEVGETKHLSMTLKWINGESNFGLKANAVNITNTENEAGYDETTLDDNVSTATVITSIKTGETVSPIVIAMLTGSLVICLYMMIVLISQIGKGPDIKKIKFLTK